MVAHHSTSLEVVDSSPIQIIFEQKIFSIEIWLLKTLSQDKGLSYSNFFLAPLTSIKCVNSLDFILTCRLLLNAFIHLHDQNSRIILVAVFA